MALLQANLADEILVALDNLDDPGASAEQEWAEAFGRYFYGGTIPSSSTLGGVAVLEAGVDAGVAEMASAMTFDTAHTPVQGAGVIATGLVTFWLHMSSVLTSYWPLGLPPLTLPPGVVGGPSSVVAGAILASFGANQLPGVTRVQAATSLATAIHLNAGVGGSAVLGVATVPIL